MLIDLFGILPFNLILGHYVNLQTQEISMGAVIVIVVLRTMRIVSSWQSLKIFSQFEVYLKKYNFIMSVMKSVFMLYFLGHWITCSWHFTNEVIERGVDTTWLSDNNL